MLTTCNLCLFPTWSAAQPREAAWSFSPRFIWWPHQDDRILLPRMTTPPAVCMTQGQTLGYSGVTYALNRARTTTRQKFLNLCSRPTMNRGLSKYGWFSLSSSSCTFLDQENRARVRLRARLPSPNESLKTPPCPYLFISACSFFSWIIFISLSSLCAFLYLTVLEC